MKSCDRIPKSKVFLKGFWLLWAILSYVHTEFLTVSKCFKTFAVVTRLNLTRATCGILTMYLLNSSKRSNLLLCVLV